MFQKKIYSFILLLQVFSIGFSQTQCTDPFITVWDIGMGTDRSITIPANTSGQHTFNYRVEWGDGNSDDGITGAFTHNYLDNAPRFVTVNICGNFPTIRFTDAVDRNRLLEVVNWGNIEWKNMASAFENTTNLRRVPTDGPILAPGVASFMYMFKEAHSLRADLNGWDVSQITNMQGMFHNARLFNSDLSNWQVDNVTNMMQMFQGACSFNGDIDDWNVSSVRNIEKMFSHATNFNRDISSWNVSSVNARSGMYAMFQNAISFDQNIGDWDVSSVTNMWGMFNGALSFDRDLGDWNISSALFMGAMFDFSNLSVENYDNTLIGWANRPVNSDITLGAKGLHFCNAEQHRQGLIDDFGWTITGDCNDCMESLNCCDGLDNKLDSILIILDSMN